ncbi:hypothetical protein SAMN04487969_10643 [Paenibacillus algorifonticola]|uniref:3-keto-disaccharide hydrolase domain-containing protein n=1 Tax=Paenibacillus algorifonticola TaxID=684063 RepID=A0A1I2D1I5_9BACL|nr:hypothetical protein [Paenibacillus algorifonticola]SFE74364.1 hypothetical protein SAMN04487969_10643 [Paenibacillus algorifonticola]
MGVWVGLGLNINLNGSNSLAGGRSSKLIAADSFDRDDNSSVLGLTDTGQPWISHTGTWGIQSQRAYTPAGTENYATVDVGLTDYKAEISLSVRVNRSGLVFRFTDSSNWYRFVLSSTTVFMQRRLSGTTTSLSSFSVTPTDGDTMKIIVNGSQFQGYYNNELKVTVTDTTFQTPTLVGLESAGLVCRLDNFKVEVL